MNRNFILLSSVMILNSLLLLNQSFADSFLSTLDSNNPVNTLNITDFEIGPSEQRISLSIGGYVIFKIGDLDGAQSVRLEYKPIAFGSFMTIPGFSVISSCGIYQLPSIELQNLLGVGIFVWRVVDNSNPNHFSQNNLLIVIL